MSGILRLLSESRVHIRVRMRILLHGFISLLPMLLVHLRCSYVLPCLLERGGQITDVSDVTCPTLRTSSNMNTSQGILRTPMCWNPNSSSASLNSSRNKGCSRNLVGTTNLFSTSPTDTVKQPLGMMRDAFAACRKLSALLRERPESSPEEDNISFFHFLRIQSSQMLDDFLGGYSIGTRPRNPPQCIINAVG